MKNLSTIVPSPIETRINGSFLTRFWIEFFSNSIYYPIALLLLELLIQNPLHYLSSPKPYTILFATVIQSYWLTHRQTTAHPDRLWGNLIAPALYTLIEGLLEGIRFFTAPQHLGYWFFSLLIGLLQHLSPRFSPILSGMILVIENVIRAFIPFFLYIIFETSADPNGTILIETFFDDKSHQFIGWVILFLGFSIGLANVTRQHYLDLLKETTTQLRIYSEWLLGRNLLRESVINPSALNLTRRERTILFMDIRGFTRWSEVKSPEEVVDLLNQYYHIAESILDRPETIKFKISADEVLAVFSTVESAIETALNLRLNVNTVLSNYSLGVGIGLHTGLLVEGLLGTTGVKFYDVIGDTVNTAKRIESAALSNEVLISETIRTLLGESLHIGVEREIIAKGKENPVVVYPVHGLAV